MELGVSPTPRVTLDPALPDRAGRGTLCATISALAKDFGQAVERGDQEESSRIERRLDQSRAKFYRMYGRKVPHE